MMCVHPDIVQFPFPCTDSEKKLVRSIDAYDYTERIIP